MAIQQTVSIATEDGRYGLAEMMPEIKSLADLVATLETLQTGETLVSVIDTEEGHFVFIGNSLAHHLWAVTTRELQRLKHILNTKDL